MLGSAFRVQDHRSFEWIGHIQVYRAYGYGEQQGTFMLSEEIELDRGLWALG